MRETRASRMRETVWIAAVTFALFGTNAFAQDVPPAHVTPDPESAHAHAPVAEATPDRRTPTLLRERTESAHQRPTLSTTQTPELSRQTTMTWDRVIVGTLAAVALGTVALYCLLLLVEQIGIGGFVGVETHWGGFGGAGGGWRLTPALVYLITSLAFLGCATALAMKAVEAAKVEDPAATDSSTIS
jgi:hypothetical protein